MEIIRPLQISFNSQVLEQNRKFYFTASATLGVNLQTGEELLDLNYFKDVFECMGENPLPDMGMPKPNGEFLVSGNYYASEGKAVTGGEVKVRLGEIEKRVYVFGPRQWQQGFPSKPEEIVSMPLEYTKAFGGEGFEKNPDGIGFKDGLLPCLEDPGRLVALPDDKPDPVGFSPLHPMLPQRMKYQGTYDADYKDKYFPGYPEDHDWKYFLCAPEDQWIKDFHKGNEGFTLYNMHPEVSKIEGRFPDLQARCFVNQKKEGREIFGELPLNLDTIWFFPEKFLGLLIFRGVTEVADDEAETISHVLCAYEERAQPSRTVEYYKDAFKKRKNSDDGLLKNLKTQDLIPEGHKSAMALLMEGALSGESESALSDNLEAKAEAMQKMADEKIEEVIQQAEENMENVDIPDKAWEHIPDDAKEHMPGKEGKLDIRKLMTQKSDGVPDPDLEKFNTKLEAILPGITAGDPKKFDMTNFSFEKIDELMAAVDEFVGKKEKEAKDLAKQEIEKAKGSVKEQIENLDKQIEKAKKMPGPEGSETIKQLEDAKKKVNESLKALDDVDLDGAGKTKSPLPRVNKEELKAALAETKAQTAQIDPQVMEAMQHVQAMRERGIEDERTKDLEKQIDDALSTSRKQVDEVIKEAEKGIDEAEKGFKEGYIMTAHFMDEGLTPHKVPEEDVKKRFLEAVANGENVAEGDWACLDLSGENLDRIDLSGAFLEQVNFKGASLKGANLSFAIMARAILEDADLSDANLEEANIGAVHAAGASFVGANLKSAKLSKGDFTGADFSRCTLDEVESLEIVVNNGDFTEARMPGMKFIESEVCGAKFSKTDLTSSVFIDCTITDTDCLGAIMPGCSFVNVRFENVCFDGADLTSSCFVAPEPEKAAMKKIRFVGACLNKCNFMNLAMQGAILANAEMENACFNGADLTGADLSRCQAKSAQFRKARLAEARLDHINLMDGSLAKAYIVNASLVEANLHGVDFLRANIANSHFIGANLENTLIKGFES